jgi:YesN/AraC family two-component response regulator
MPRVTFQHGPISKHVIIILSCERDQAQVTQGIELGANDYIIKPPNRYDFEETISKWVQFDTDQESPSESFQFVNPDKGKVQLSFRAWIAEVNAKGFTLAVDHLIKKSATFYICGSEIKKITPSFDRLLVTVTHSTSKMVSDKQLYFLQIEIDPSHQQALNEIRLFLVTQFSGHRSSEMDEQPL